MLFFIKRLTGETISIELDEQRSYTWYELKLEISEKNKEIDPDTQVIVVEGRAMDDSKKIDQEYLKKLACIHLVRRWQPDFTLKTHTLYAVVHNFYEKIEQANLCSFQKAIPLSDTDSPQQLIEKFKLIYKQYEDRIAKNKTHETYQTSDSRQPPTAKPVLALVAVENKSHMKVTNGAGLIESIVSPQGINLSFELLSYMLEDGTSITGKLKNRPSDNEINRINMAFRLFCAEQRITQPQYQDQINNHIKNTYGEVKAYLDLTIDSIFDNKTQAEKQDFIRKMKLFIHDPNSQQSDVFYSDMMALDVVGMAEHFPTVQVKLKDMPESSHAFILDDCKKNISDLLLRELTRYEQNLGPTKLPMPLSQDEKKGNSEQDGLSKEERGKISELIGTLVKEYRDDFFSFNQDRKKIKIMELSKLYATQDSQHVSEIITQLKKNDVVTAGFFSRRTKNLLSELEIAHPPMKHNS